MQKFWPEIWRTNFNVLQPIQWAGALGTKKKQKFESSLDLPKRKISVKHPDWKIENTNRENFPNQTNFRSQIYFGWLCQLIIKFLNGCLLLFFQKKQY